MNAPALTAVKQSLASFVSEMSDAGVFGRDENGNPVGPRPTNRRQARDAIGGRQAGRGRRTRAAMRNFKRARGLS